jgi:serine protease Do
VNLRGEVIGINTAINSRTGSNAGVGFAIPSSMARQIMEGIIKNGRVVRGFIGASLATLTLDAARDAKLPEKYRTGVVIDRVLEGGPAAKAGLTVGDIIVSANGKPVRDGSALRTTVALTPVGQVVNMTAFRNGKEMEFAVRIEEQTDAKMRKLAGTVEIEGWDMTVSKLTAQLAELLGVDERDGGVVITSITRGGKADKALLQPGDIFMKINGKDLTNPEELGAALKNAKKGLRILLRRGNHIHQLILE